MKKFLCVWGTGYLADNETTAMVETYEEEFFTAAHGYDEETIVAINSLEIGAAITVPDITAYHSVVRIY